MGDGLRGTLGAPDRALVREYRVEVLTVEDADTIAAMRLLWQRMKLLVEPSSAIALAMVLGNRERLAGQRVGVVLWGGHVDLDASAGGGEREGGMGTGERKAIGDGLQLV